MRQNLGASPAEDLLDEMLQIVRENERLDILLLLCDRATILAPKLGEMPRWRAFLWAIIHPVRFYACAELSRAVVAINNGAHTVPTGDAPKGDQPSTGSDNYGKDEG